MPEPVLHEYARSGNCYKIRLTAAHTGATLERREYDIMKSETRTPEFLAGVNANGRIPCSRRATVSCPRATPPAGISRTARR